jgi:ABC-2 type transport system ATP-binding protein
VIKATGDGPTTTTTALAGGGADATEVVVEVSGLRVSYDGFEAVRGIDLQLSRGEIFTFLGPNGAGKTSTVEVLEGHRKRTAGDVKVLGEDPERADRWWRSRVGVVLQTSRVEPQPTVRECLELYAGYYPAPRSLQEVIELVGLEKRSEVRCGQLSGGQQRRVDVALALIGDPELVFLDEPTTGFDPSARRSAWEMIDGLRGLGKTIFLTTHYMEEAEALAERVAVLSGRDRCRGNAHHAGWSRPSRLPDHVHPAGGSRDRRAPRRGGSAECARRVGQASHRERARDADAARALGLGDRAAVRHPGPPGATPGA